MHEKASIMLVFDFIKQSIFGLNKGPYQLGFIFLYTMMSLNYG